MNMKIPKLLFLVLTVVLITAPITFAQRTGGSGTTTTNPPTSGSTNTK